jgi:hypothetical protein
MDETEVVRATERWVREVVVGLNLCPFATVPLRQGRIRFEVCREQGTEAIYRALLAEMEVLLNAAKEVVETSLLIVPQGLDAFADYLDLLDAADAAIPAVGLDGVLQLASFHPYYQFEGAAADDPANYTNRSPYPMFHLIREDSLAQALEGYANPQQIPQNNIDKLRKLGLLEMQRRLQACRLNNL